jgi:hypothetical protein
VSEALIWMMSRPNGPSTGMRTFYFCSAGDVTSIRAWGEMDCPERGASSVLEGMEASGGNKDE